MANFLRPSPSPQVELQTFADAIQHLTDYQHGGGQEKQERDKRRAILSAYRDLALIHDWRYYETEGQVMLNAPYSTGTITYDHCVTEDHEALTRKGWKQRHELKVGDEILAYDHDTEMCSWQPIEAVHVFDYDGEVLEVMRKDRCVLRCTPNHRVPIFERYDRRNETKWRKKFVLAKDLRDDQFVPLSAPLDIESSGDLDVRLSALLSWCVTDGSGLFNRKYHATSIYQSHRVNEQKCKEIESATCHKRMPGNQEGMSRFPLTSADRNELRAKVFDKTDVVRIACEMGVQEAEAAVRAMILAEASTNINGQKVFTQWGDNFPIAEAFQIACLLTGRAANLSRQEYGNKIRYQVPVRHKNRLRLMRQSRWVPYCGTVWCPQVRTTAWVMRCNGAVMITGNSGGAAENLVTLAGGTVPTWAIYGRVNIANKFYPIQERLSGTTFTLHPTVNPGADVASGTSYEIVQDIYTLPGDLKNLDPPQGENVWWMSGMSVNEWQGAERHLRSKAESWWFAFGPDPNLYGSMAAYLYYIPSAAQTLRFTYRRWPRPLKYSGVEAAILAATISATAGASTATLSSAVLSDLHVGSVLRFGDTSNHPEGREGLYPYVEQKIITDVSSTTVTLDSAVVSEHSAGTKFTVSDPLDLRESMLEAFLRGCEYKLSIGQNMDDKRRMLLKAEYEAAVRLAIEADVLLPNLWRPPGYYVPEQGALAIVTPSV